MPDSPIDFGTAAKGLARNPLGIIALFIVLVYGFASLVTAFAQAFTAAERMPLVYFMVTFPVLVLLVFTWLVSRHSGKLFSPSDFKDEGNYVRMQLAAVASLAAASSKNPSSGTDADLEQVVRVVQEATPRHANTKTERGPTVLWVDDRPENNTYERQAFEALGIKFALSLTTSDALAQLGQRSFAAVISDMGRKEGPREGYGLLDALRARGDQTPLFFYASSNAPEHKRETLQHGGQGCTNDANELFKMVTRAVIAGAV